MPIRTNRGRTAVYRRLWGWPLRSPRHFGAAVVLVAAVATGVGFLLPTPPPEEPQSRTNENTPIQTPAQPTSTAGSTGSGTRGFGATSATSTTRAPLTSLPQAGPAPAAPAPEALAVAESWGKAWVNHPDGITTQTWLEGLKPLTTDEYLTVLSTIDPRNVPANAINGKATSVSSTSSSVEASLPTDTGPIRVTVITTAQGWRVAMHTKAQ